MDGSIVEIVDQLIHTVGPIAFLVLGAVAFLEYLCPPLPGDTILLLGGVYAVRGEQSWLLVFLAIIVGSMAGAAVNHRVGWWLGTRAEKKSFLGIHPDQLHHHQERMRKYGAWLLVGNRFLPGVRTLIFVAAGAAQMPLGRVLFLGTISAIAHTAVILAIGAAVGGNLERLEAIVSRYQKLFLIALIAVGVLATIRFLVQRWRKQRRA